MVTYAAVTVAGAPRIFADLVAIRPSVRVCAAYEGSGGLMAMLCPTRVAEADVWGLP